MLRGFGSAPGSLEEKERGLKDNAAFCACVCVHVCIFETWHLYGGLAWLELFI